MTDFPSLRALRGAHAAIFLPRPPSAEVSHAEQPVLDWVTEGQGANTPYIRQATTGTGIRRSSLELCSAQSNLLQA